MRSKAGPIKTFMVNKSLERTDKLTFYGITSLGCKLSYGTNQFNKIQNNNND